MEESREVGEVTDFQTRKNQKARKCMDTIAREIDFRILPLFSPSLLLSSTSPSQIGQPVYARVSCRKTFRQTGMTRRKVGRRISVTIDGPDLRTSAGRRNRPIDNAAPPKGLENFARIYCRSSFEKLGNRNAWKINARHFSLLN